jgi:hypothetical protein
MNANVYKMTIHEILQKASDAKTGAERIKILQDHNCLALRDILKGAIDENVVWILPPGAPEYESGESMEGFDPSSLHQKTRNLAYFVKGGPNKGVKPQRLEKMFLEILESIPKVDAEVLIAAKDKKLHKKFKGMTRATVEAAFPKLLSPLAKTAKPIQVEDEPAGSDQSSSSSAPAVQS